MSSFEWMELQTLTSDINAARTRLATARASKDNRLARMLEQEITAAEKRRDHLLVHITTELAGVPDADAQPAAGQDTDLGPVSAAAEDGPVEETTVEEGPGEERTVEASPVEGDGERQSAEIVEAPAGRAASGFASAPRAASVEGELIVWNQLTPGDLLRAKDELAARRTDLLARHAEELKALDADQNQLDGLEQAIGAFLQRFTQPTSEGAVVMLGEQRESRRA